MEALQLYCHRFVTTDVVPEWEMLSEIIDKSDLELPLETDVHYAT